MPEIPERPNPQPQGMDDVPALGTGSYAYTERELNQKERAAFKRELKEKEARRIKPGFAIPPKEEDVGHEHLPAKQRPVGGRRGGAARGHRRAPARGRGPGQVRGRRG